MAIENLTFLIIGMLGVNRFLFYKQWPFFANLTYMIIGILTFAMNIDFYHNAFGWLILIFGIGNMIMDMGKIYKK